MAWLDNFLPSATRAAIRYLIQRYLGQYVEEKITREQINFQIFQGVLSLENLRLSVDILNAKLADQFNWPVQFIDGHIGKFHIDIPYRKIFSESVIVTITDLELVVQPKPRQDTAQSVFESMWNSMTSSMNLAEECVKLQDDNRSTETEPIQSLENFATVIESVLERVIVRFIDTTIIVEHAPKTSQNGVGLVINIDNILYRANIVDKPTMDNPDTSNKSYLEHSYTTKMTHIEGVTISTLEFPSVQRFKQKRHANMMDSMLLDESDLGNDNDSDKGVVGEHHVIPCGKIPERIEVFIRLKQAEHMVGPKVVIEFNFDTFLTYLSPRQVAVIHSVCAGLLSPDFDVPASKYGGTPMCPQDYVRIEQDLKRQMYRSHDALSPNNPHRGWTASEDDELFVAMRNNTDTDEILTIDSSQYSNASSTTTTRWSHQRIEMDPSAEISKFHVHVNSLVLVVLHEDVLVESGTFLNPDSVRRMCTLAADFFAMYVTDLDGATSSRNHLRLLAGPVILEADEKTTQNAFSFTGTLEIGRLELYESLYVKNHTYEHCEIIRCPLNLTRTEQKSSVRLKFKYLDFPILMTDNCGRSKTDLIIELAPCCVEFDVTLVDRIAALLRNFDGHHKTQSKKTTKNNQFDVQLQSAQLQWKLRFPKLDFRPQHDLNRTPWWTRNIRNDYLLFTFNSFAVQTRFAHDVAHHQEYVITTESFDLTYLTDTAEIIRIADAKDPSKLRIVCSTSVSVPQTIVTHKNTTNNVPEDVMMMSTLMRNLDGRQNSPFSRKKVVYESEQRNCDDDMEEEQLLIPGTREELRDFIRTTSDTSRIFFDIQVPHLNLHLLSKHTYELLYNRINNDLLLWEPSVTHCDKIPPDYAAPDIFSLCRSDSSSSSSGTGSESNSDVFYSTTVLTESNQRTASNSGNTARKLHHLSVRLRVNTGRLVLRTAVRESGTNNVIPGQCGEFIALLDDCDLFTVNGYESDTNLAYTCCHIRQLCVYHSGRGVTIDMDAPAHHHHRLLYQSGTGPLSRDSFSLALKVEKVHETHHVKNVTLTMGMNQMTLRHRPCPEPNSWLSQWLDFFNVTDYPIPGYRPKEILTELYLHFWDCTIDYRPEFLDIRSVVQLGTFRISSHLTADIHTSALRFICEDCGLYIAHTSKCSSTAVNLGRDYVKVVDIGLFEISLKTTDPATRHNPHILVRAANNLIEVRTCADSAKMLAQLLTYLAANGDLEQDAVKIPPRDQIIMGGEVERQDRHEQLTDLLTDALIETEPVQRPIPQRQDASGAAAMMRNDLGVVTLSDLEDEYCVVNLERDFNIPKFGQYYIKWLVTDPVRIVEDHFTCPTGRIDPLRTPKDFPVPVVQYTLCDMSVVWKMYGGEDFPVAATQRQRTTTVLVELHLNKIKFQHEIYAAHETKASRQVLIVTDFEILDKLESSQFNKFLCQFTSESRPKQSNAHMLVLKLVHTRPDINLKTQECCLKISLLPLRFNIDQDTLLFLIGFFNSFSSGGTEPGDNKSCTSGGTVSSSGSRQSTPVHQAPVMTLGPDSTSLERRTVEEQAKKIVDENLLILLEEPLLLEPVRPLQQENQRVLIEDVDDDYVPIYFRKVVFTPDVPILLDYHGKHFDLTHGPLPGLLMGLAQLRYSELTLKRIYHRHGVLGVEKLVGFLLQEWLMDIRRNQLPRLLGGLGPMHSFVQLFQGVRDLFWLPIEQYKKDGRFLRGLHRGANSFTTSTAMAALELTTKILHLIQVTAETAFDMLTPGPSVRINPRTRNRRRRLNQPKDLREGVTNAYKVVKEGLEETAGNIVQMAAHEHEQKGYSGAVGGVIRHIPPTMIKPIIIMSEATNNVLGGMKCQLVPDARKDVGEKWRHQEPDD